MLNQHPKKHRHAGTPNIVRDPLVDPGNPSHRYQARSTAHLDRPRSRMVALAASPPGPRSPRSPQAENATVMIGRAPQTGDVFKASIQTSGSNAIITVFWNGVQVLQATDTNPILTGNPGMGFYNNAGESNSQFGF